MPHPGRIIVAKLKFTAPPEPTPPLPFAQLNFIYRNCWRLFQSFINAIVISQPQNVELNRFLVFIVESTLLQKRKLIRPHYADGGKLDDDGCTRKINVDRGFLMEDLFIEKLLVCIMKIDLISAWRLGKDFHVKD